ncbi:YeeE/YedE thiosulfate transporter family protein [Candidatus Pelagibacter sp.]|nr:YeeE/YedE thiosulfate transporter family protein [Candidatus Pelagibacter sp.]
MNIVNFTPITATLGGMIIGLAVVIFFLFNGRLIGISGIAANALTEKDNKFDNLLFLLGLILGPILYTLFTNQETNITISNSFILLIIAGLLVGIGTRISGGCTSGHGISGIGRFSLRSIIATITFMIIGILTVLIKSFL